MKLAVVVQRYGADINGGAEQHARYIAERLATRAQVEVVTTCARDYVTWKNELPAGVEDVHGIYSRRGQNHPLVAKLLQRRGMQEPVMDSESEIASAE